MSNSKEIRQRAWNSLRDRYWNAFVASLIVGLLMSLGAFGFGNINIDLPIEEPQLNYSVQQSYDYISYSVPGSYGYTGNTDIITDILNPVRSNLIIGSVIAIAVIIIIAMLLSTALSIFFCNIILVGEKKFFIENTVEKPNINLIFSGFKNYKRNLKAMFLIDIKVFLWSLLFIIPGIVKAYEYALVPYILAENPEAASKEAFERSAQLMHGNKWRLFKLEFSFIGWGILALFTCGIGFMFLAPYVSAAMAEFYAEVSGRNNTMLPETGTVEA